MKRSIKKYLFAPVVLLTPFALLACKVAKQQEKPPVEKGRVQINENLTPEEIKTQLQNINSFDFVQFNEYKTDKSQLKASDLVKYEDIIIKVKDPDLKDKIKITVQSTKNANDERGTLTFGLKIEFNNTFIEKDIEVSGFRQYRDPSINLGLEERLGPTNTAELQDYINSDLYGQYKLDNKKYIDNFLKGYINFQTGGNISKWREEIKRDPELINKYNKIAAELHLDDFETALLKGFALPQTENGETKLNLYDKREVAKAPGWSDISGRDHKAYGVPRILPNQKYKDYALDTYSVTFTWPDEKKNKEENSNNNFRSTHGTMWTMDFVKKTDGKYPTKWYFGTNMHVADTFNSKTTTIGLINIKEDVGLNTKIPLINGISNDNDFFNKYNLQLNDANRAGANVIFEAKDFLSVDPADYLIGEQKTKYKDYKEMLDFAVIEIDFEKFADSKPEKFSTVEDWVKEITHDYANQQKRHIKFLAETYLKNYDKAKYSLNLDEAIKEQKDNFYIIGYPISTNDWGLDMYQDKDYDPDTRKFKKSLWINGEPSLFDTTNTSNLSEKDRFKLQNGDRLSSNLGFRSFADKPGLLDAFIGFPKISNEKPNDFYTKTNDKGEKSYFINFGLEYSPRHFAPEPGASGSVIRNQKNELIAVFHSKEGFVNSGLAAAFRSEGFDYQGLYGSYNLPQYDLIYGGGKEQTNSFRQALMKKYGSGNFQTNLFSNLNTVPDQFNFNKTK
ncbi:hypothetical protein HGG64_00865 [Mycoplasma phocoeninasale]|uniref:DUF31 domain-containing protein n=1 Tax=Mycoplasma phocoeninasale TaxID=2726117 RepID=A0A858U6A1_9MOLU|nr:lipoprotein 17-related variable surface protein [Mycoplasma phocoeninasale]QJG66266.1 hypothetical protein HGG64_00865 [Mycoplasma phocoeninasale]